MAWKLVQILLLSTFFQLLTTGRPFSFAATSEDLKSENLNILFTERAFLGVNPFDVEAVLKVFVRTLGRKGGYDIQTTINRFKNDMDLGEAVSAVKPDLLIVDSWTYLTMENTQYIEPLFICSAHGKFASRYLLMVRPDRAKGLTDLQGKSLNLLATANANLGIYWLKALLGQHGLGQPEAFFGELTYQTDPMPTILQVFFDKKDAALVDSDKFELMAELNPQLKNLRIIASSEPLVNAVICLKKSGPFPDHFRRDVIEALTELHLDPAGKQILTMFKVQQLKPFKPNLLNTVRQLREIVLLKSSPIAPTYPSASNLH